MGERLDLTSDEIAMLRESLTYSIRHVEEWWAKDGQPETAHLGREKVEALTRLRQKLGTAPKRREKG